LFIGGITVVGCLALGKFANDKSDATRQQQGSRSCHLLVYIPNQRSGANTHPPLTIQHLSLRIPDFSRQGLGFASV
jgi:hypothetical protein